MYPCSVSHIFQVSAGALIRTPIEDTEHLGEQDESPVSEMSFTGPVFVGCLNITLIGSPKDVYHEIIKRNPDYDAWDFPDCAEEIALEGITRENFHSTHPSDAPLAKRDSKVVRPPPPFHSLSQLTPHSTTAKSRQDGRALLSKV
jgi:hypothetical protein